jgi:hypothetical protein
MLSARGPDPKVCAAGLCLAVIAAMPIVVTPVQAQTTNREVNGPRARVTVEPRSFLDAGTEVLSVACCRAFASLPRSKPSACARQIWTYQNRTAQTNPVPGLDGNRGF